MRRSTVQRLPLH